MRTYRVFLYVFAALLLCDYGMFSDTSPSPPVMSSTEITNTSGPYTTAKTGESETIRNDSIKSPVEYPSMNSTSEEDNSGVVPSVESTSGDPSVNESSEENSSNIQSTTGVTSSAAAPKKDTTVSYKGPVQKDPGSITVGIIILILILILIVFLLGILYYLRKKGRSYSFDLTRVEVSPNDYVDTPLRSDQQGISYEQTNIDLCLDYIQEEKSEEKTNPIANGSAGEKTEQTTTNENDEQNVPEENSFSSESSLTTPGYMKKVEFDLDLDLLGGGSDSNDSSEAEATGTPQNENNNNVSNAGRGTEGEIFTEISLDEPK